MKNIMNKLVVVAVAVSLLASCKPENALTVPKPDKGQLDLTSYVAVGNSLTSGFQNGGLYYSGQKSSYANVLAEQFKLVNPNLVFKTPYVEASSVGIGQPTITTSGTGIGTSLIVKIPAPLSLQNLKNNCTGAMVPTPYVAAPKGDGKALIGGDSLVIALASSLAGGGPLPASIYNNGNGTAPAGPYQNMGVPGAKAIDVNRKGFGGSNLIQSVTPNFSNFLASTIVQSNPYFSRFAKNQATSSMLSDAMDSKPTFFSLFIGNNDVLLWAVAGGVGGAGGSTITPVPEFSDSIDVIVNTLTGSGAKGLIVNIAQITGAPFFTYNKANTNLFIVDENGTTRNMYADELILLTIPQDSLNCLGLGATSSNPIPKKYTLTRSQIAQVTSAVNGYNAKLYAIAQNKGLAFFDMNKFTIDNLGGSQYNGMELTGQFVTGGIFGLDGLHLTPRGYAAIANEMIKVINARYLSNLPGPDLTKYDGVTFPK